MTESFNPETGEVFEEALEAPLNEALEQFKQRIYNERKLVLSPKDPVHLEFYILEAFLEDLESLIDKRDKKLSAFLNNSAALLGNQIEKTVEQIKEKAVLNNLVKTAIEVEAINEAISAGSKYLNKTRKTIFWLMVATWLAAVPVFITLLLILTK